MGHWKFGQEISDERCVDGRIPKGHVALSLAVSRNEDELAFSDTLLRRAVRSHHCIPNAIRLAD